MFTLIHGDNLYKAETELKKILKQNPDHKILDGSKLDSLDDIFISMESMTLFTVQPNLTIVKRFTKNRKKSLQDKMVEKAKEVDAKELNIVFWEDQKVDKRGKFYKHLKKAGKIVECNELDEKKILSWLQQKGNDLGLEISKTNAIQIIDRVGVNQFNLISELEKLALLLHERTGKTITIEDLNIISKSDKDADIWKLMDAISSRNKKQIMVIGNEFLRNQSEYPYLIAMITRQLKILMLMKHPQTTSQEISSKLKIHPYTLSRARKHLHLFDIDRIKLLINKLSNLDFAIKEGRIDPKLGLNLFLASL